MDQKLALLTFSDAVPAARTVPDRWSRRGAAMVVILCCLALWVAITLSVLYLT